MLKIIIMGVVLTLTLMSGGLAYIYEDMTSVEISNSTEVISVINENIIQPDILSEPLVNKPVSLDNFQSDVLPIVQNKEVSSEIISNQPLIKVDENETSNFGPEVNGIVSWTNAKRLESNLNLVLINEKLSEIANYKLNDLIARNYFTHISPDGDSVGDLALDLNYSYSIIGENLAYGNFKNSEDLVQAWYDSPGHRDNILNANFSQIGVAVRQALFQGSEFFVAVQVFATPAKMCELPDDRLKKEIELKTAEVEALSIQIIEGEQLLQNQEDFSVHNEKVLSHNNLVHIIKALVVEYNLQVKKYNSCTSPYPIVN